MIYKYFPLILYLHIFQLEGYQPERLLAWVFRNFKVREVGHKKPLVWTLRAHLLYYFALFLTGIVPVIVWVVINNFLITLLLALLLILQPYLQLVILSLLVKPYIYWDKWKKISITQNLIKRSGAKVIGITGSFGKTSVKEILYQILKTKYKVLRTPKSYNTVSGIAKVVEAELDQDYDFLICELAAYERGEIKELVKMVTPKYGILTGIAPQHLERFGSLQNIIDGKFELIEGLPSNGFALLNTDNDYINYNLVRCKVEHLKYGLNEDADIRAISLSSSIEGSEFELEIKGQTRSVTTKILGKSSVQNILAAAGLSVHLGMSIDEVKDAVKNLKPIHNRLELVERNGLLIINDSFNSNIFGFKDAVDTIKSFKIKKKVLITPGIIELGTEVKEVHKELGGYCANTFNKIFLVGNSERSVSFKEGLLQAGFFPKNVETVSGFEDAITRVEKMSKNETVVLIENDLPDQY